MSKEKLTGIDAAKYLYAEIQNGNISKDDIASMLGYCGEGSSCGCGEYVSKIQCFDYNSLSLCIAEESKIEARIVEKELEILLESEVNK